MAAVSRLSQDKPVAPIPARRRPRLADAGDTAVTSPALETQSMLVERWEAKTAYDEGPKKWSPRKTAAFLLVTCGGFWALVGFGVYRALG